MTSPANPSLPLLREIRAGQAAQLVDRAVRPQHGGASIGKGRLHRRGLTGLAGQRPRHPEPQITGAPDRPATLAAVADQPRLGVRLGRIAMGAGAGPHAAKGAADRKGVKG